MTQLFFIGKISGAIIFAIGLFINYTINKRRFSRRSITGIEVYRSFEHSWTTRWTEGIGKLVAVIFIITGALIGVGSFILSAMIK